MGTDFLKIICAHLDFIWVKVFQMDADSPACFGEGIDQT
jgi:hypothetical protein